MMTPVQAKARERNCTAPLQLFGLVSADIRHQFSIKIPVYCVAEAFL